ncbi:MAG: O-antigen ligase family protein [Planctomycetales bacterium]|nr:O-antigen ligase family protein [Planctomycetales bacterium]
MSVLEKLLLLIAVVEIPLQLDTHLFYQEADAQYGAVAGVNVSLTTFCLLGLYTCWLSQSAVEPSMRRTRWASNGPLVAYLMIVALSIIVAQDKALTLFRVALLVQSFALFFYVSNRVRAQGDALFLGYAVAASLLLQSLLILATRYVLGARSLGPLDLEMLEDLRPGGTMASPVVAGSVLALLTPVAVAMVSLPLPRKHRIGFAATAALAVLAVVVTQTRGAIISLGASSLLLGGGLWRRGWLPRWTPAAALAVGLIASIPLSQMVHKRLTDGDAGSARARIHLSQIAADTIEDGILFGHGAGNCHLAMLSRANSGQFRSEWFYSVHCKYLLVWVETGLIGLAAFLCFMLSIVLRGLRGWKAADRVLSPLALACAAAIVGQMIHMTVDTFNSRIQVQTLWLAAGLVTSIDAALVTARRPLRAPRHEASFAKGMAHVG